MLALNSLSFGLSAGILACWVRARPALPDSPRTRPTQEITRAGLTTIFGTPALRVLVLFGWLAGFTVVPEGLAAPYAHTLGGGAPTVGLLLAAAPAGLLIGAFVLGRLIRPAAADGLAGHAVLRSADLLPGAPAGPGGRAALGAGRGGRRVPAGPAAAFIRALPGTEKARAFAVAQSGLLAAQVAGLLAAGAVAKRLGPPAAVALAGLLGLVAAALLATDWIRRHAELLARLDGAQLTNHEHELTSPGHELTSRPPQGRRPTPADRWPARPAGRLARRLRPAAQPPGSAVQRPGSAAQPQARAPAAARRPRPARRGPASCRPSS